MYISQYNKKIYISIRKETRRFYIITITLVVLDCLVIGNFFSFSTFSVIYFSYFIIKIY